VVINLDFSVPETNPYCKDLVLDVSRTIVMNKNSRHISKVILSALLIQSVTYFPAEYAWYITSSNPSSTNFELWSRSFQTFSSDNYIVKIPSRFHTKGSTYNVTLLMRVASYKTSSTRNISISLADTISVTIEPGKISRTTYKENFHTFP
jgi:uncharacterized protein YxjI